MFTSFAHSLQEARRRGESLEPQPYVTRAIATADQALALVEELNTKRADYGVEDGQRIAPTALVDQVTAADTTTSGVAELVLPHLNHIDKELAMSLHEVTLAYLSDTIANVGQRHDDITTFMKWIVEAHRRLYNNFVVKDSKRADAVIKTRPTLDASLDVTFALTGANNDKSSPLAVYKKYLTGALEPLSGALQLAPQALVNNATLARLRLLVGTEWPNAFSTTVTVARYIDFATAELKEPSAPLQAMGNWGMVKAGAATLDTIHAELIELLSARLSDYRVELSTAILSSPSLLALELANSRTYYTASAISDEMDAKLATTWRLLATHWHEWMATWTLLAVRSHNDYLTTVAIKKERSSKKEDHKTHLGHIAQMMTLRRVDIAPNTAELYKQEPFKVVFETLPTFKDAINDDTVNLVGQLPNVDLLAAVLFYRRLVSAWTESAQHYNDAKTKLEQALSGSDVRYRNQALATLRSPERLLHRLLKAWLVHVRDVNPLDATLGTWQTIAPNLSVDGDALAVPKKQNSCFRYERLARFWTAWLVPSSASPNIQMASFEARRVASLHATVAAIYAYVSQDMYEFGNGAVA